MWSVKIVLNEFFCLFHHTCTEMIIIFHIYNCVYAPKSAKFHSLWAKWKWRMSSLAIKCAFVLYTYSALVCQDVTNPSSDVLGFFSLLQCIIKPVGAWNKSATLQNTLLNTRQKRTCFASVCELSVSVLELMKGELKAYPLLQQWEPPCHHLLPPYHFLPPSHILFFFFPLLL